MLVHFFFPLVILKTLDVSNIYTILNSHNPYSSSNSGRLPHQIKLPLWSIYWFYFRNESTETRTVCWYPIWDAERIFLNKFAVNSMFTSLCFKQRSQNSPFFQGAKKSVSDVLSSLFSYQGPRPLKWNLFRFAAKSQLMLLAFETSVKRNLSDFLNTRYSIIAISTEAALF